MRSYFAPITRFLVCILLLITCAASCFAQTQTFVTSDDPAIVLGFRNQGAYNSLYNYSANDVVAVGSTIYFALSSNNQGHPPAANPAWWAVLGSSTQFLPLSGGTLSGPLILAAAPTQALQAATKGYVDTGVGAATALATSAGTAASTAQSTAVSAQTTANTAQAAASTAMTVSSNAQATATAAVASASLKLPLAGGTMTGPISLAGDPASPTQAANKNYVDNLLSMKLAIAGGTMAGPLYAFEDPLYPTEVATKNYVDGGVGTATALANAAATAASLKLPLSGGTMTGALYASEDPLTIMEVATKRYVDANISSIPSYNQMVQNETVSTATAVTRRPALGFLTTSGIMVVDNPGFGSSRVALVNIPNSSLANSSMTINAGTGLSGGSSVNLGGALTLSVNSAQPQIPYSVYANSSSSTAAPGFTNAPVFSAANLTSFPTSLIQATPAANQVINGYAGNKSFWVGVGSGTVCLGSLSGCGDSNVLGKVVVESSPGYLLELHNICCNSGKQDNTGIIFTSEAYNYYHTVGSMQYDPTNTGLEELQIDSTARANGGVQVYHKILDWTPGSFLVFDTINAPGITLTGASSGTALTLSGAITAASGTIGGVGLSGGGISGTSLTVSGVITGGTIQGSSAVFTGVLNAGSASIGGVSLASSSITATTVSASTVTVGALSITGRINLSSQVTGNLPTSYLNSGTGASSSTFWRGDGQWATVPSGATSGYSGSVTTSTNTDGVACVLTIASGVITSVSGC